ncbi:MAG: transporter substrate-binding protein [Bacilli bacterium]|nr:transporter substrate-binding protein [Bacilli bacterium]
MFSLVLLLALLIAGCGSTTTATTDKSSGVPQEDTTPITLTIGGPITADKFNSMVGDMLQKRFPYITFTFVFTGYNNEKIQDMVAASQAPDILISYNPADVQGWSDLGLTTDLNPLVSKYKIDLSRYDQPFIQNILNVAPAQHNELFALPYYGYRLVLFYNKDIFDKYGVAYPKDNMTWPQVIDLAKQVTKNDGSTQYRGLQMDSFGRSARQYPLLALDPKTDKPIVTNDQWVHFFQIYKSSYDIPGNLDPSHIDNDTNSFLKDKTLAMWAYGTDHWDAFQGGVDNGLHWDMVSWPSFPDIPGQGPAYGGQILGITSSSQHKDQAFRVISYIGSDEVQTHLARVGYAPSISSSTVHQQYGADMQLLQGKNIGALFGNKPAVNPKEISRYDSLASSTLNKHVLDIVSGKKDINTALREAADDIDIAVQKAKQAQAQK